MKSIRLAGVIAAALVSSGCLGDPATEAPLTMAPGLYEVEMPGLALAGFDVDGEQEATKKLCLRPGDGDYFAHRVVRETLAIKGCGDPVNKRSGNLLDTTISCQFGDKEVQGEWHLRGSGRIRAERFASEFKVDLTDLQMDDPEARQAAQMIQAMQGLGGVSIDARRVGDCPA